MLIQSLKTRLQYVFASRQRQTFTSADENSRSFPENRDSKPAAELAEEETRRDDKTYTNAHEDALKALNLSKPEAVEFRNFEELLNRFPELANELATWAMGFIALSKKDHDAFIDPALRNPEFALCEPEIVEPGTGVYEFTEFENGHRRFENSPPEDQLLPPEGLVNDYLTELDKKNKINLKEIKMNENEVSGTPNTITWVNNLLGDPKKANTIIDAHKEVHRRVRDLIEERKKITEEMLKVSLEMTAQRILSGENPESAILEAAKEIPHIATTTN